MCALETVDWIVPSVIYQRNKGKLFPNYCLNCLTRWWTRLYSTRSGDGGGQKCLRFQKVVVLGKYFTAYAWASARYMGWGNIFAGTISFACINGTFQEPDIFQACL